LGGGPTPSSQRMSAMLLRFLILLPLLAILAGLPARAATLEELAARLPGGSYGDRAEVIAEIAATGDTRAIVLLEVLTAGDLHAMKADGRIVRIVEEGSTDMAFDALTDEPLGELGRGAAEKIKVNNALRRAIAAALGALTLQSPDRSRRLDSAAHVLKTGNADRLEALDAAIAAESDPAVREAMLDARAAAVLNAELPAGEKIAALQRLAARGDADGLSAITAAVGSPDPQVAAAAGEALAEIRRVRAMWEVGQNVWYGLSLGSVLLLAAIGLAITFGVMGVINMAHGELVMLGAYTTFVVQEVGRAHAPWLMGWSLLAAAPLAFLVAGALGVAIERGICRHLYGRPLETLLATWGVSLILQQAVRTIFGPTNRQVTNPDWMSGAFQLGQLTITWNRLWIVVFALVVFTALLVVLKRTPAGLQMRAVTQNRRMAEAMGIRSGRVDAMTFGLGAGVAGLAGVALSQIDNVSPNLGQSYIVDSFMVVVFGGVGNLWGALAGAFTLGIVNKFLEPYAGAVLGKVLVLVFIILFIQRRPRGLFALRGRAVEA
jgi:urea transport system permease protein